MRALLMQYTNTGVICTAPLFSELSMTHRQLVNILLSVAIAVFLTGCAGHAQSHLNVATSTQTKQSPKYAIENVNVVPMTGEGTIIENATVVVVGRKIASINGPTPAGAQVIDGTGKWLIPGLIDMHVHNLADVNLGSNYPTKGANLFMETQGSMLLYVANGVTTAFELSGRAEHIGQRNEIVSRKAIGPRLALAFLIDGGDSGNFANTPSDGRQTVRLAKAQGFRFIKVYSQLNVETYQAIIDEAEKQEMKVIGHIPITFKGHTEDAFIPHFGMVAHAEEFSKQTDEFTQEVARKFAKLAKDNGTWLTPNLSNLVRISQQARSLDAIRDLPSFQYVHPLMRSKWIVSNQYNEGTNPKRVAFYDQLIDFHVRLVKAFKEAGVPIVAGTDSGTSGIVWGFSLHDELELLVAAGLTPEEALRSATILPATWLGIEDRVGTVEAGKFADLLLLNANPLNDIDNTRNISGVFFDGKWVSKDKIDVMLHDLAEKNNLDRDKYDWRKRRED